jgi:hypothetical protein
MSRRWGFLGLYSERGVEEGVITGFQTEKNRGKKRNDYACGVSIRDLSLLWQEVLHYLETRLS